VLPCLCVRIHASQDAIKKNPILLKIEILNFFSHLLFREEEFRIIFSFISSDQGFRIDSNLF